MFLDGLRNGVAFEKVACESIYSNMRTNLFDCLDNIGLFDYMADINEFWRQSEKTKNVFSDLWDKTFNDYLESRKCGIKFTQACNCAILRNKDSNQPSKATLNEIRKEEPNCLFNRFQDISKLKLIIFLGATLDLKNYWRESCYYNPNISVCAIPHPSGSNRVFNNGDLFKPLSENDSTQLRNAKNRLIEARQIINNLKNELTNK